MPPVVFDLNRASDVRDVVHLAVQALVEGKLVVFPTETTYGVAASALQPEAVDRLVRWKAASQRRPLCLAVRSLEEALDFAPDLPAVAHRIARRCWPGPLTLVVNNRHPESALEMLPQIVREAVTLLGTVAFRVPAHDIVRDVLRLVPGPVVWTSASRAGEPDSFTATDAVRSLADQAAVVLDGGRCKFAQPTSVVRVSDHQVEVLRAGVLTAKALRQLSSYLILFVCTGNTCRSPMAELLMRHMVAQKLGLPADRLAEAGVLVASAGTAAFTGSGPAAQAVEVMHRRGLDLSHHESQPLTDRLVRFADVILTMTHSHREQILQQWPFAAGRVHLLSPDGHDITDPIGGTLEQYSQCAMQIERCLQAWLNQLDVQPLNIQVLEGD
jgi:tRNA threonylcarbamoyl adenosine modification protein (Sua5/YciO/YrdC/YwlC family)